jgi:phenylalanyl-tRNA synthetase alpha chain
MKAAGFHQIGIYRFYELKHLGTKTDDIALNLVVDDMKDTMEGLFHYLYGESLLRWVPSYYPYASPSFEVEGAIGGLWNKMIGGGVIQRPLLKSYNMGHKVGWVATLSLDRMAMKLFDMTDIRMLLTEGKTIDGLKNKSGERESYQVEVGFSLGAKQFHENDLLDIVRSIGGITVKEVEEVPKPHAEGHVVERAFKISYSGVEKDLDKKEVEKMTDLVIKKLKKVLKVHIIETAFTK